MRRRGTLLLDLDKDITELWQAIRERRRTEIRRGEDLRPDLDFMPSRKKKSEWTQLFLADRRHLGLSIPRDLDAFLESAEIRLHLASYNGRIISGEVFSKMDARSCKGYALNMVYSATDKTIKESGRIHAFLIWKSILWAKENGFREYNFGGWNNMRPGQEGINLWKESFGGDIWWSITSEDPLEEQLEAERAQKIEDPSKIKVWLDDGHVSLHSYGRDLFRRLEVKPIMAIVAGRVGKLLEVSKKEGYFIMDTHQIEDCMKEGWEIASHGMTHRDLAALTEEEFRSELSESKKWIMENLGICPKKFVAPYNSLRPDQIKIAKEYYDYIRPKICPRPPQRDGVHAIIHRIFIYDNGALSIDTATPLDIGFRNYIIEKTGQIITETGLSSLDQKFNLATYSGKKAVTYYSSYRNLQTNERIAISIHMTSPGKVLDVGCGAGRISRILVEGGFTVVGIDISQPMIEEAKRIGGNVEYQIGDATKLKFEDESFDYVMFTFNGLDSIYPDSLRMAALREMRRVLRKEGTLIFSSHSLKWAKTHPDRMNHQGKGYFLHEGNYGITLVCAIDPKMQEQQLNSLGYELIGIYGEDDAWIYYAARKI